MQPPPSEPGPPASLHDWHADNAPLPPTVSNDHIGRTILFCLLTVFSALFIIWHFVAIPKVVKAQGGNRLNGAAASAVAKVVLMAQLTVLPPSMKNMGADGVEQIFQQQMEENPTDYGLREQYALLMLALGNRAAATKALDQLQKGPRNAAVRAIRDAFALDRTSSAEARKHEKQGPLATASSTPSDPASEASDRTPLPLRRAQAQHDRRALEKIEGWTGIFALQALAVRQRETARANELEASIQQQAQQAAVQVGLITFVLAGNFLLGIVVLAVWLLKGRTWNLRSIPASFEDPPAELAFDPLAGWSMLLAFECINFFSGVILLLVLGHSAAVGAQHSILSILCVQMIIYALILALIALVVRGRWQAIGLHARSLGRSLLAGLCLFWGAFIIIIFVGVVLNRYFSSQSQNNPIFQVIDQVSSKPFEIFVLLFLAAFLGPLFEEILFRGVLYTSMRRVLSPAVAIPANGVLFSLVHGDVNSLIPLAVLGMLLAYGYERTHSLATSTVVHCLWNLQTMTVVLTLFS